VAFSKRETRVDRVIVHNTPIIERIRYPEHHFASRTPFKKILEKLKKNVGIKEQSYVIVYLKSI
jgi:hypothetical protein